MENRPANPTIKSAVPRTNPAEPQTDKKATKTTTTTTTTKSTTQKATNSSKPTVNAPVKPMPNKKNLSPMDDRLSDEECKFIHLTFFDKIFFFFILQASPESEPTPAAALPNAPPARRSSHTTLGSIRC
jgi:hypothetical protein